MLSSVLAETMLQARSTCHETRYGEQISWLCDVPVEEPMVTSAGDCSKASSQ